MNGTKKVKRGRWRVMIWICFEADCCYFLIRPVIRAVHVK